MADTPPFEEDFFERVVDVKWESEPEVFWMIGSGAWLIGNGMPYGDTMAWIWTSENGKSWKGKNMGIRPVQKGFGVFYTGCWMRQGMVEGAKPVWVMGGGTSRLVATSAMGSSTDGKTFGNMASMDETHVIDLLGRGSDGIFVYSMQTFSGHVDYFYSFDGIQWNPANYHGGDTSGGGGLRSVSVEEAEDIALGYARATNLNELTPLPVASLVKVLTTAKAEEIESPLSTRLLSSRESIIPEDSPELLATTRTAGVAAGPPGASTRATGAQTKADKMVYIGNGTSATGKVRSGPLKGKRLMIAITPYHYYPDGGDHGDSTVAVYDMKNGQRIRHNSKDGLYDTGLKRSIRIGYGHYTFVVVGSSGGAGKQNSLANTKSTISWSTTGVTWKKVELGIHDQINAIAVGPRPKYDDPTDNPIEEPPPPVVPPTGQPPKPPDPSDGGAAAP